MILQAQNHFLTLILLSEKNKILDIIRVASISERLNKIPLRTGRCPMTTTRKGRRYLATVSKGETTSLQGDKSDVKLEIREGCPKRAYLMEVRTDLSNFESIIPDDECFISPVVGVLAPAETSTSEYVLRIPHCLDENGEKTKVKVRIIHENRNPAVVEVPVRTKCTDGVLFYDIDSNFIELHTKHFCLVTCTYSDRPLHCLSRINSLWFAQFQAEEENVPPVQKFAKFLTDLFYKRTSSVEIRPYFGGFLYDIVDFQKVKFLRYYWKQQKQFYLIASLTLKNECKDGNLKFSYRMWRKP